MSRFPFPILFAALLALAAAVSAQTDEGGAFGAPAVIAKDAPRIHVEKPVHDFGRIDQGEVPSHSFVIENRGGSPLQIEKVEPSCGCTVAKISARDIPPGESGEITISFRTGGRKGKQKKTIAVYTNDPRQPSVRLEFHADVFSDVAFDPERVFVGKLGHGESGTRTVRIRNAGTRGLVVTRIEPMGDAISVGRPGGGEIELPQPLPEGGSFPVAVTVTYPERLRSGVFMDYVRVYVEGRMIPYQMPVVARLKM